jgi:L-rhamnose 1-dehydrogenase
MSGSRRVVLVTGASRGIGRATAIRFARDGDVVVVNHPGDDEAAAEVVAAVAEAGGVAMEAGADVSSSAAVEAMVRRVLDEHGRIDVLVNNAGICPHQPFFEITEELFDRVIDVNLKGQFLCAQAVARSMVERRSGCIVAVSSMSAFVPGELQAHYCASKAGVMMLMRTLSVVLGRHGVRVNSVLPGSIRTDIYLQSYDHETVERITEERVPLGRIGLPEDIANAVHYLASDEAAYANGAELLVDGGFTQFRL